MHFQPNAKSSTKAAPLRSEVVYLSADETKVSVASLDRDPPKVSASRLEQYLNPGNPICSG